MKTHDLELLAFCTILFCACLACVKLLDWVGLLVPLATWLHGLGF